MKILYDYQIFRAQKYGGISRYFCTLISLNKKDQIFVPIVGSINYYLKEELGHRIYKETPRSISKIVNVINRLITYLFISICKPDIVHATYFDKYLLKVKKRTKLIITIHDMIHERMPDLIGKDDDFVRKKKELILNADHIIAISEHTKKDIVDLYHIDEGKIEVIYHGLPKHFLLRQPRDCSLPTKFILYVGERRGYKNFSNFVSAVSPILTKDKLLVVLCSGGKAFTEGEIMRFEMLGVKNQFIQRALKDEELIQAYQQSELFVFPSLYEGFGIPILEAFACGCPVALSNASCFPEVAKTGAVYFDPYDPMDMMKKMLSILSDEAFKNKLVSEGKQLLDAYSVEKTFNQTRMVYQNSLNSV